MYAYLEGKIEYQESSYIVIDVNNIGFKVFTPNPYVFEEGKEEKIYLYNHVREDETTLFGFKKDEWEKM